MSVTPFAVAMTTNANRTAAPTSLILAHSMSRMNEMWSEPTVTSWEFGNFSATIANVGGGAASSVAVRFVVDGAVVGTDRIIGTLAPGATATVTSDSWPAKRRGGQHTVEVRIDPVNAIEESNEANNNASASFSVPGNK